MQNNAGDIAKTFQKSRDYATLRDDLLKQFIESDRSREVNESVEKLIASDLEANPRLTDTLSSMNMDDTDRITAMFERRVRSEIEAGMAGKPFEEFMQEHQGALMKTLSNTILEMQGKSG